MMGGEEAGQGERLGRQGGGRTGKQENYISAYSSLSAAAVAAVAGKVRGGRQNDDQQVVAWCIIKKSHEIHCSQNMHRIGSQGSRAVQGGREVGELLYKRIFIISF